MNPSKRLLAMAALALAILVSTSMSPAAMSPLTQSLKAAPNGQVFKWWTNPFYKKELGLTAEQTRRMEEIFQNALPTLKIQKTALDEAEARFERLIERGDDREVMEQVNVVEATRADLNKTRTIMLLGMRKVLTSDQWAKFTALHQAAQTQPATGPAK
jgi:Spy/CpxP family protein refolding chaperone